MYTQKSIITKVAFTLAKFHKTQLPKNHERKSLIKELIQGPIKLSFEKRCIEKDLFTEEELVKIQVLKKVTQPKCLDYISKLC